MIVGTHAIFREQVQFNGPALVIIDEQHRFGVHQRLALWEKGQQQGFHPHQLIMTATPIPHHGDDRLRRPRYLGYRRAAAGPNPGDYRRYPGHPAQRYY